MTQFEDVLETILEEYARRDSEGEFDTWEETDAFVKEKAEVLLAYVKEEPVSEDLEEASKEWLKPQLDKSYSDYGETKMMELTHFDGYAMLDAIEFGAKWQKGKDEDAIDISHKVALKSCAMIRQQTIQKACNWLKSNVNCGIWIMNFKKSMEE